MYVCVYVYACMCVCMYVRVYACMCVCRVCMCVHMEPHGIACPFPKLQLALCILTSLAPVLSSQSPLSVVLTPQCLAPPT